MDRRRQRRFAAVLSPLLLNPADRYCSPLSADDEDESSSSAESTAPVGAGAVRRGKFDDEEAGDSDVRLALPLTKPNAAQRSTTAFHRLLYMLMADFVNS